jgi:plastocyanin
MVRLGVLSLVLVATLASSSAAADPPQLRGTVGPGFTISLIDATGASVKHLDPGTYLIHIDDVSEFHNFHLSGPGVNQLTGVDEIESADWTVTFVDGTYTFLCDAHATTMKGTFTVGTPPPPPPPPVVPTLKGSVGPGSKIAFVRTAAAGKAKITIRDLTAKDNFHLSGPGVNKKTRVAFKGTVTWTVTLQPGTYTFRSDAHTKLKGVTKVK